MHIGDRIKRERRKRGWTQGDLAKASRVPQPLISRLESHARDNVTMLILRDLARALGCSMDYLAGMYDESEQMAADGAMVPA